MKIKGLAMEILELIAVSIDFPCSLISRFECSSRNIYRIIGRLIDAGLIKRFRKDKMGSLRLTKKGQAYLLEHDRGRIGKIKDKIKYSKSEEEKRKRLHRLASTYCRSTTTRFTGPVNKLCLLMTGVVLIFL